MRKPKLIFIVSLGFILLALSKTSAEQLSDFNIGVGVEAGWLNLNTPAEEDFENAPFVDISLISRISHLSVEFTTEHFVTDRAYLGVVDLIDPNRPIEMLEEKLKVTSVLGTASVELPLCKNKVTTSLGLGLGAYHLEGEIKGRESRGTVKSSAGDNPRIGYHFVGAISTSFWKSSNVFVEVKYRGISGAGFLPAIPIHVVARRGMKIPSVSVGLSYYLF